MRSPISPVDARLCHTWKLSLAKVITDRRFDRRPQIPNFLNKDVTLYPDARA